MQNTEDRRQETEAGVQRAEGRGQNGVAGVRRRDGRGAVSGAWPRRSVGVDRAFAEGVARAPGKAGKAQGIHPPVTRQHVPPARASRPRHETRASRPCHVNHGLVALVARATSKTHPSIDPPVLRACARRRATENGGFAIVLGKLRKEFSFSHGRATKSVVGNCCFGG